MGTLAVKTLELINSTSDRWIEQARQHIQAGENFFLILPDEESTKTFCELFGLEEDCQPESLTRSDFLRLSQYVDGSSFNGIMEALESEHPVLFVDQLDFPINSPPNTAPFIVYSPIWGIISQHDSLPAAREALADYHDTPFHEPSRAGADVYKWDGKQWHLL